MNAENRNLIPSSESEAWGIPSVIDYFKKNRLKTSDVYHSEWFFLKDLLYEGMSVLDVGCAIGGFANILSEHVRNFDYVGIDVSEKMIEEAKKAHPNRTFHLAEGTSFSFLNGKQFDVVLCLGILHLNKSWRPLLSECWSRTKGTLLFDLRETHLDTIEDERVSYFKMNFNNKSGKEESAKTLPYNIINSGEALAAVHELTPGRLILEEFGYFHGLGSSAVSPINGAMMKTYMVKK